MGGLISKRFDEPDETLKHSRCMGQVVVLGEVYIGRYVFEPGWVWSKDVKPAVGTPSCRDHHQSASRERCGCRRPWWHRHFRSSGIEYGQVDLVGGRQGQDP